MHDLNRSFPEDDFDLESFKKKVVKQKRERFWSRNSKLFSFISTLTLIALSVIAYFVYGLLVRIL